MASQPDGEAAAWLEGCPARLQAPLGRCARGETPPNIAVMHLLIEAVDPSEAEQALTGALERLRAAPGEDDRAAARLDETLAVLRANPQAFATVKAVLDGVEHEGAAPTPEDGIAHWARTFDRAARASPEGSVALYALGNPDLLRAATDEVVARMRDWGLLGADRSVLEIGCGNGRFQAALAPEVGFTVGIDVSGAMIEAAARNCAGLANVRVSQTSGRDLSLFPDASSNVVLAVDSFPYLVQCGKDLVERHFEEAARVLTTGGHLLILNFSYRGDPEADRRDVARLAANAGFRVLRDGERAFALWDGAAFQLEKS